MLIVPTDTEYAMELISQRVARGLPVRPKRRQKGSRRSSDASVLQAERVEGKAESSSVEWNKWGGRIVSTKEKASELKQMFHDGQVCIHLLPWALSMPDSTWTQLKGLLCSGSRLTAGRR